MMSAAAVVVCALKVLGRSPSTLPPIALVPAPAGMSSAVEGFVRPGSGVISLVTDSEVFEAALNGSRRAYTALVKLASIIVHEEWHVRYGADERGAYQAQLDTLAHLGVPFHTQFYMSVLRSMLLAVDRRPTNATYRVSRSQRR
jgi:hypothetical protein